MDLGGLNVITVSDTDTPSGSVVMWLMMINPSKGFRIHTKTRIEYYLLF